MNPGNDLLILFDFLMDLTKIIQTHFSNAQLYWILLSMLSGLISILLFTRKQPVYSLFFLFLAGLILRLLAASLDPFLWTWDEQYHALVAKNMLHNPFKPVLISNPVLDYDFREWKNNYIWLHKQPWFLWQIAFFFRLFEVNEFYLRLPSVLMMSLLILVIFRIGQRISTPSIAWYGAFIYTFSCFFIDFVSGVQHTDHNDSAFIFYVTLSIWAWIEYTGSKKRKWLFWIGLFAGIAIMNKWIVGLLVYSGWFMTVFLAPGKKERFQELKKMGISLLVTLLIALPWQIFILFAYPRETRFEFLYNAGHFFTALEGHSGNRWYYPELLSAQFGGLLILFIILPGLILLFKSIRNRSYQTAIASYIIITYLFFTLAATKMPMFCNIVFTFLFLALGAFLDKCIERIREYFPSRFFSGLIVGFLCVLAYLNLNINRIDEEHSVKNGYWKKMQINAIIDKQIAKKIPSSDYLVFNGGKHNATMLMFYGPDVAYNDYPTLQQFEMLKKAGIKMAVLTGDSLPGFLRKEAQILKIHINPIPY